MTLKKTILISSAFEEVRELLSFVLESKLEVLVFQFSSGNELISHLQKGHHADLIICEMPMKNGNSAAVLDFLKRKSLKTPLFVVSANDLKNTADFDDERVTIIKAPYDFEQILATILTQLPGFVEVDLSTFYIPVSLNLLVKMKDISTPLFIKINENKFVKVTQNQFEFNDNALKKYQQKGVSHLYVETVTANEFISEFKKKTMSDYVWKEAEVNEKTELIKLNTELLRDMAQQLGWNDEIISLAEGNVKKALHIAYTHPNLQQVFHQFHKIERFGYADHCVLLVLISTAVAFELGFEDENTIRKLTFAALFHDMSLSDHLYENKKRYLQLLSKREASPNHDLKEMLSHPTKAAELCRHWDYCPSVVDTIIFQHHEEPNGHGFPMGKTFSELHPLSCLFIVCEDFVNYFVDHLGKPDNKKYVDTRKKVFNQGEFLNAYNALTNLLEKQNSQLAS